MKIYASCFGLWPWSRELEAALRFRLFVIAICFEPGCPAAADIKVHDRQCSYGMLGVPQWIFPICWTYGYSSFFVPWLSSVDARQSSTVAESTVWYPYSSLEVADARRRREGTECWQFLAVWEGVTFVPIVLLMMGSSLLKRLLYFASSRLAPRTLRDKNITRTLW